MQVPLLDLLGLRLRCCGDCAQAEGRLAVQFPREDRGKTDLTVRFFTRDLPETSSADSLAGVGFRIDTSGKRLDYLLTRQRSLTLRRVAFVETVLFAHSIIRERQRSFPGRHFLFLHASGVVGRRGALIFCGYSTYGKSTIARLLAGRYPRFADDFSVLLCESGGRERRQRIRALFLERYAELLGDPLKGRREVGSWALPVAALFWLKKGKGFGLRPLGKAQALAAILPPIGQTSREALNKARWVKRLLEQVPCHELEFSKDSEGLIRFLKKEGYL